MRYWFLSRVLLLCTILPIVVCFFASRRRHTRCALVTGVQTCALPILGRRHLLISTDGVELTKRERSLIRKLIAGFKAVYDDDYESPLLDELIALRDKL